MTKKPSRIRFRTRGIVRNNRGQGLVEYALILVLIAVVVVAAVRAVGTSASSTFSNINSNMGSSASP